MSEYDTLVIGGHGSIGSKIVRKLEQNRGVDVFAPPIEKLDVRRLDMIQYQINLQKFNYVVYCAGENYLAWTRQIEPDKMLELYNINVVGFVRVMQMVFSKLGKTDPCRVVVVGSDAADHPMRTSIAYNASKAALRETVKIMNRETHPDIIINEVAPGVIEETNMTNYVYHRTKEIRGWDASRLTEYMKDGIPAGRFGRAQEVADVVGWLLYDAPSYLAGAVIPVNGGR